MKYIVYCTINIVNNKIYIGVHGTNEPYKFDNYLGCGVYANSPKSYNKGETPFKAAVHKYGPKNFRRITLFVLETLQEALELESKIVDENFLSRKNVYNITLGGGYPPLLEKKVYQYDLKGNFIKEWKSIVSITNELNCNKDMITMVVKDKRSFCKNYWSYNKYEKLNIEKFRTSLFDNYIYRYSKDGILLNTFKSFKEASDFLDLDIRAIKNANYECKLLEGCYYSYNDFEYIKKFSNELYIKNHEIYEYDILNNKINKYKNFNELYLLKHIKFSKLRRSIINRTYIKNCFYDLIEINSENIKCKKRQNVNVLQYDLNGNLIKEWKTITSCMKNGFPSIRKHLIENTEYKGYIFKFK